MPLTRIAADVFGVLTICLVCLLVLLGLFCIFYLFFFHHQVRRESYLPLGYFNGPWVVRILLITLAIWWGCGEIERLDLFRREGRVVHHLNRKWQKNLCRMYILSNFGLAEPCFFVTMVLLLRGSLQKRCLGTLSRWWNAKTIAEVILFCLPVFALQLMIVFTGPIFSETEGSEMELKKLPIYFTKTYISRHDKNGIIFCMFPLMSTIVHGLLALVIVGCLFYLGTKMLSLVINVELRKRIYCLLFSVISLLLIRVLFLGFTVLSMPGDVAYEVLEFVSFLAQLVCAMVSICILVYFPTADALELRKWNKERRIRVSRALTRAASVVASDRDNANASFIANPGVVELASTTSVGRSSDDESTRVGSISFRTMLKGASSGEFEDVNLFSGNMIRLCSPPESPALPGWPRAQIRPAPDCSQIRPN